MKTITTVLLTLICVSVYGQKSQELSKQASNDWYKEATENLLQKEYNFKSTTTPSVYRTVNPKNQLGFLISTDGFSVHNLKQTADVWNVEFRLKGAGKTNDACLLSYDFIVSEKKSTLVFGSPGLDIEYINNVDGLRQNFIVKQRPEGKEKLKIQIGLNSNLDATVTASDKLVFHSKGNKNNLKLVYDDLKVGDANGTILKAGFELHQNGELIEIVVDDKEAVYPITVDPLNRTAERPTSADGILPSLLAQQRKYKSIVWVFCSRYKRPEW